MKIIIGKPKILFHEFRKYHHLESFVSQSYTIREDLSTEKRDEFEQSPHQSGAIVLVLFVVYFRTIGADLFK